MKIIKLLLILFVFYKVFDFSVSISNTWESQANPRKGVTVTMHDGQKLTGDLSKDWNGLWCLNTGPKNVCFSEYQMMESTAPVNVEDHNFFVKHWRSMLLPSLLFMIFVGAMFADLVMSIRRNR